MKTIQTLAAAALAMTTTFAVAAPDIGGSVTVSGNTAKNIVVTGGSGSASGPFTGGSVNLEAAANINSVVVRNGKIGGSVRVINNKADDLTFTGGTVNVNSVVVGR